MQARKVAALAEARKVADQNRRNMVELLDEQANILSRSNFEIKTTEKIERRRREALKGKLRENREQELYKRRAQLAELFNQEMKDWSAECMGREETLETRKAKLLEKAYALRNRREAERRKQVENAYNTVWRDGCDDLRDLDGKALTVFMSNYRGKQIEEKKKRQALAEINENSFVAEWTKQLNAMQENDNAKNEKREQANRDTAAGLREQIAYNEQKKEEHYQREMADAMAEISEINAALQEEKDKEMQRKLGEQRKGKEILAFNEKYKSINAEKQAVLDAQDKTLLDNALRLEREKLAEEEAKRKAGADAAKQYRKYLDEMMIKEAEDTSFVDDINKRETEKVWKARDDALQARQDARDYLMKLVDEGRQEQIQYKTALEAKEKEDGRVFAARFINDIKEGIEKDRAAADARRANNIANNEKLIEQMAEREKAEQRRKQEIFLDDKHTRHVEEKHKARLAAQGGVVRLNYPKKAINL